MDRWNSMELPPGFRFHPTDGELITYLRHKEEDSRFTAVAIAEVDLNRNEPWELPGKAKMMGGNEEEMYFYCKKDRKYPTGRRTNRATRKGFWKATGKDKRIIDERKGINVVVGIKKTLVFHTGRAPNCAKTGWVMHEYRLAGRPPSNVITRSNMGEWVVCRIIHKKAAEGSDGINGDDHSGSADDVSSSPLEHPNPIQQQVAAFLGPSRCSNSDCTDVRSLVTAATPALSDGGWWESEYKMEQLADQLVESETSTPVDLASIFMENKGGRPDEDRLRSFAGECLDLTDMWTCVDAGDGPVSGPSCF